MLRQHVGVDHLVGQRAAHEHDPPGVVAGHRLAAGDQPVGSEPQRHPSSVGRSLRARDREGTPVTEHERDTGNVEMDDTKWYWDLVRGVAVRADERGPGDQTMGPYDSRYEAEHWRERVEQRNQSWDDEDEEWRSGGDAER